MSYRDDRDADQARIAALEHELAETRDKLTELEGKQTLALARSTSWALVPGGEVSTASRVFGPGMIELSKRFDAAYPVDRFEELVDRIREITHDAGRTELLRSSLTWFSSRGGEQSGLHRRIVTVSVRGEITTLTVTERLGGLAGAIYGGVGGGVGGGGLSLPILASVAVPVLTPVFLVGWLGGVFLGTRALYLRSARRRRLAAQQLFDALVDDIERVVSGP